MCNVLFLIQIRVNTVNPTVVMTDIGRVGWSDPVKAKEMLDKIPLGRFSGKYYLRRVSKSIRPLLEILENRVVPGVRALTA